MSITHITKITVQNNAANEYHKKNNHTFQKNPKIL